MYSVIWGRKLAASKDTPQSSQKQLLCNDINDTICLQHCITTPAVFGGSWLVCMEICVLRITMQLSEFSPKLRPQFGQI